MSKINLFDNEGKLPYTIVIDSFANDNVLDIYIKFLPYLKQEEIAFIDSLKGKDISALSQGDLDEYYRIKMQLNMVELFKKYKNKECTKEEHDSVFGFMKKNPLKSFLKKRISFEDYLRASKYVRSLLAESRETLEGYITMQESRYDELSVYDAYVLFEAKELLYEDQQRELYETIAKDVKERERRLIKALSSDYGTDILM